MGQETNPRVPDKARAAFTTLRLALSATTIRKQDSVSQTVLTHDFRTTKHAHFQNGIPQTERCRWEPLASYTVNLQPGPFPRSVLRVSGGGVRRGREVSPAQDKARGREFSLHSLLQFTRGHRGQYDSNGQSCGFTQAR